LLDDRRLYLVLCWILLDHDRTGPELQAERSIPHHTNAREYGYVDISSSLNRPNRRAASSLSTTEPAHPFDNISSFDDKNQE